MTATEWLFVGAIIVLFAMLCRFVFTSEKTKKKRGELTYKRLSWLRRGALGLLIAANAAYGWVYLQNFGTYPVDILCYFCLIAPCVMLYLYAKMPHGIILFFMAACVWTTGYFCAKVNNSETASSVFQYWTFFNVVPYMIACFIVFIRERTKTANIILTLALFAPVSYVLVFTVLYTVALLYAYELTIAREIALGGLYFTIAYQIIACIGLARTRKELPNKRKAVQ